MQRAGKWFGILLTVVSVGVMAEEVTLPFKGLTLGAELKVPAGKKLGEGPVVLMTHGTLAHGRMEIIANLQQALLQKGYASLAINLSLGLDRRTGMYDCTAPQNHRHTDALDEIGLWLDWLKRKGAKEVVLLGHSRGGNQTAWFAAEHSDPMVSKVVLIAPMTWSAKNVARSYRSDFGKELRAIYARAEQLVKAQRGDQMLNQIDFLHCPQATVTAASFVDYYRDEPRFDSPSLLRRIHKPVLVVVGSEDQVVTDLAQRVGPMADADQLQLWIVDGADHFFRDLYADELADNVSAFLAGP